jgi:hypothetical protein
MDAADHHGPRVACELLSGRDTTDLIDNQWKYDRIEIKYVLRKVVVVYCGGKWPGSEPSVARGCPKFEPTLICSGVLRAAKVSSGLHSHRLSYT